MTYIATNRRSGLGRFGAGMIGLVFVLLLIAGMVVIFPSFFDAIFGAIARPFWRTEFAISAGALSSNTALVAENERLRLVIADLEARGLTLTSIEEENAELHRLLGRASSTPGILGAVISRPPLSPYDQLTIDIGAGDKIRAGYRVFAPGDIPVGIVKDVTNQTSKVLLYSSPGQEFDVLIGSARIPAKIESRGGGQFEAELPRGSQVAEGDWVIFSSLGEKPMGKVASLQVDEVQALVTAIIVPPINVYSVRMVYVKPADK